MGGLIDGVGMGGWVGCMGGVGMGGFIIYP